MLSLKYLFLFWLNNFTKPFIKKTKLFHPWEWCFPTILPPNSVFNLMLKCSSLNFWEDVETTIPPLLLLFLLCVANSFTISGIVYLTSEKTSREMLKLLQFNIRLKTELSGRKVGKHHSQGRNRVFIFNERFGEINS